MQKEINRRIKLYGLAAVLLATILVSLCYQLGYIPYAPSQQSPPVSVMPTFSSYEELREFLKNRTQNQSMRSYYEVFGNMGLQAPFNAMTPQSTSGTSTPQYSTTNIQVAGVDEADIVKNDDEYIYLVTGNNVSILRAYPPDYAASVYNITFSDMTPVGIFVNLDRLAVLGTTCYMYNVSQGPFYDMLYGSAYFTNITTYVKVYNITDRTSPTLMTTFTASGDYVSSRMIGEYVYIVASQLAYYTIVPAENITIDEFNIPSVGTNGSVAEVLPSDIYYSNTTADYFMFTTVAALNIQNTTEKPEYKTLTLGGTSTLYVSMNNIYITFPKDGNTLVYRVHVNGTTINPDAEGEVPGSVLGQYSMDEYNDYFRIATTTWVPTPTNETSVLQPPITGSSPLVTNSSPSSSPPATNSPPISTQLMSWVTEHNVYVLDKNMTIVGMLEHLAPNENMHAARFVGDRCYLVTFEKTDPLFVINLTDPINPVQLGNLSVSGYSDYLYPYDDNYLIGVGKETVGAEQGDFAWYQGIKLALFDVSDVSNPTQMYNYTIGDRGSDSPVLSDPKAFLFDKSSNLLVIPVNVAEIDLSQYPNASAVPSDARGQPVWQGAYVFNMTLSDGFVFWDRITHLDNGTSIMDTDYYVQRSLYIDNVLYTVSNAEVKLNSLDNNLTLIREIDIG